MPFTLLDRLDVGGERFLPLLGGTRQIDRELLEIGQGDIADRARHGGGGRRLGRRRGNRLRPPRGLGARCAATAPADALTQLYRAVAYALDAHGIPPPAASFD